MPYRYFDSATLFAVALDAAKGITALPREGGQRSALISIVFSAVALEAFINEATELASDFARNPPPKEPQSTSVLAECMADAEQSHASLQTKFALASWILAGKKIDRSVERYQDFTLLIRLRNDLVHFKGNLPFEQDDTMEEIHKDLFRRFKSKNILAEVESRMGSWVYLVETKAVAEWSCKTASSVVIQFSEMIPTSGLSFLIKKLANSFVLPNP